MASLFERHRPRTWDDVVGQRKAVAMLRRVGAGGKAFWFAGPSGTGKTTMARLLAESFAEPWNTTEIDAQDCTLDFVRDIQAAFQYRGMGGKAGKAWIINEAQGLRGPVLSRFLTLLEAMPDHCTVIFTTTNQGQKTLFEDHDDASPLLSRCLRVPLAFHDLAPQTPSELAKAFAEKARAIAKREGLDGKPIADYVELALRTKVNLRAMLSEIEAGVMLP